MNRLVMGDALYPYLPQLAKMIEDHFPGYPPEQLANHYAIAVAVGENVRALVLYGDYTKVDLKMHVMSKDIRWCDRGVLRGCFSYPFNQLRVRRVTALIAKSDKHTRRFAERLGFTHEGTHPEGLPDGSVLLSYGLTRKDCKWIT